MRYMMLIYSRETPSTPEQQRGVVLRHRDVMSEARKQSIFQGSRTARAHDHGRHGSKER
jgi:hypothetical protein